MNIELNASLATCPTCRGHFLRRRKDKIYCSDGCRKTAFSRRDRAVQPRNSLSSSAKRREISDLYDLNARLNEMIYTCKPEDRPALLLKIIEAAADGSGRYRQVLTNRTFLYPDINERRIFYRRAPAAYSTPAQLANRFSWSNWKCSIRTLLSPIRTSETSAP